MQIDCVCHNSNCQLKGDMCACRQGRKKIQLQIKASNDITKRPQMNDTLQTNLIRESIRKLNHSHLSNIDSE